jgi:hypothetical protein
LTRYLAGSRSAIAGIFPTSFVVLFVRQHRQHSNCSHLVAYVGYQSCFVVLDIEDHAVSNGVRILARSPHCREIGPGRVHPFHDPDPRTERPLPVRMLLLRSFYQVFADDLHVQILAIC